jgi:hypothetical protein
VPYWGGRRRAKWENGVGAFLREIELTRFSSDFHRVLDDRLKKDVIALHKTAFQGAYGAGSWKPGLYAR